MPRLDHLVAADRLLHQAESTPDEASAAALFARAGLHAQLGHAEAQQTANLIGAWALVDELEHPLARKILARTIRRRLGLFPPLTSDGQEPNGAS